MRGKNNPVGNILFSGNNFFRVVRGIHRFQVVSLHSRMQDWSEALVSRKAEIKSAGLVKGTVHGKYGKLAAVLRNNRRRTDIGNILFAPRAVGAAAAGYFKSCSPSAPLL